MRAETVEIEGLLTRKSSELRPGVFALLLKLSDAAALASADRLLAAKAAEQRLGGLELLRQLAESKRKLSECKERAESYQQSRKKLTRDEESQVSSILSAGQERATLDNAFGLMDSSKLSPVVEPQAKKVTLATEAASALLEDLDALVHEHREANQCKRQEQ